MIKKMKSMTKKEMTVFVLSFYFIFIMVPVITCNVDANYTNSNFEVNLYVKDGTSWVKSIEKPIGALLEFKAELSGISGELLAMANLPNILEYENANPSPDDIQYDPKGGTLLIWSDDSGGDSIQFSFFATLDTNGNEKVTFMGLIPPLTMDQDEVIIISTSNNPPNSPINPSPYNGEPNVVLNPSLSVEVTDPDGDSMDVYFYDSTDHSLIGTKTNVPSGGRASVIWLDLSYDNLYYWYAVAKDTIDETSSPTWSFTTESEPINNNPPEIPNTPLGQSSGKKGKEHNFYTSTTDPDGDKIRYGWDWDDDDVVDKWTEYFDSGSTCTTTHSWSSTGEYKIKVKAEDINGDQSDWSEEFSFNVTDGKGKSAYLILQRLFKNSPYVLYIIKLILSPFFIYFK